MTPSSLESRDVHVSVPARPDYLVLARLALSAICRLTPLEHAEVADLKLAVTEAAAAYVDDGVPTGRLVDFRFRLCDDRLELGLAGEPVGTPEDEQELSRAIVEATVDEYRIEPGQAVLIKRFAAAPEPR